MNEKRFVTGGYKIYDTYKEEEYLVNNVDAQRIVDTMNNLDTKARERSKALSKLEKEKKQLKSEIIGLKELLKSYRKTIKHDAELLADATKKGYLPPLEDLRGDIE